MNKVEILKENIKDKSIEEIVSYRDTFELNTEEWLILNELKAEALEAKKPSTKENILFFTEDSVDHIPEGFSVTTHIPIIPFDIDRRSILEYNPEQRHPIPYCLVRYEDKYFFILRESGSGEMRLIGKKGLLGGHVSEEDVDTLSLNKSLLKALKRELEEEAGITEDKILNAELKGLIKSNEGVDDDHLGFVYELTLTTDLIKSEEEDVLTGIWIPKEELGKHYDSFESWSKIVYDNLLK